MGTAGMGTVSDLPTHTNTIPMGFSHPFPHSCTQVVQVVHCHLSLLPSHFCPLTTTTPAATIPQGHHAHPCHPSTTQTLPPPPPSPKDTMPTSAVPLRTPP